MISRIGKPIEVTSHSQARRDFTLAFCRDSCVFYVACQLQQIKVTFRVPFRMYDTQTCITHFAAIWNRGQNRHNSAHDSKSQKKIAFGCHMPYSHLATWNRRQSRRDSTQDSNSLQNHAKTCNAHSGAIWNCHKSAHDSKSQ